MSGTDSDSDLELPTIEKLRKKQMEKERLEKAAKDDNDKGDISDSDLGSAEEEDDVRKWGSKKEYYYGGNTGEELEHASVTLLPGNLELVEDLGRVLLLAGGEGDKVDLGLLDGQAKHT